MRFTSLTYSSFRNIFSGFVDTDSENIVLYGSNGQGKTNILESVYILSYGSSFRTSALKECVHYGDEGFSVSGSYTDGTEKGRISVSYYEKNRKIILDGKEIRDRKALIYQFPCIVFCHEDINYIKGEPEYRRRFFDQMMCLYSPSFFDSLRSYKSVLMQRNASVRTGDKSLVSLYDSRLALYGLMLMDERKKAVEEFNRIFPGLFREISGTDYELSVVYQPSWKSVDAEDVVSSLRDNIERDLKMNTTSSGPHRDRFTIMSQYGPFVQMGSTGQIRLCSLIFRIAEAVYYTSLTSKEPILLIDDVLLELDSVKRGKVLSSLPRYSQAFFTFLPNEEYNDRMSDRKEREVREGKLYEREESLGCNGGILQGV